MSDGGAAGRGRTWLPLLLALGVSAAFESRFLHHGINQVDEGWPLYAAMQLHAGGTLYRDVFFVFPPGHLLSAWVAWALAPPGVVLSRCFYAGFDVALVGALFLLGRRLMPAGWALVGALLVAVATPNAHLQQLLFGYRYLVFAVLALLAFSERLRGGGRRWMFASGACVGVLFAFRLTPALAAAAGLGLGVLAAGPGWGRRLRDAGALAAGAGLVVLPVLAWLLASAGPEALWREVVVRPVAMTALQAKPLPPLGLPRSGDPAMVAQFFVALLFRMGFVVYAGYALALGAGFVRARLRGARPPSPLLLAAASFGGIFFVRSLGRSDEPHLMSALPPLCLMIADAFARGFARLPSGSALRLPAVQVSAAAALLAAWTFGQGAQRVLDPAWLGDRPLEALAGRVSVRPGHAWLDPTLRAIDRGSEPGERILVLGPESLLYVLSGRRGPGYADVVMPGTFLDEDEEIAFLERLAGDPPRLVVMSRLPFDLMPERAVTRQAPTLSRWIRAHYEDDWLGERFLVMRRAVGP